MSLATVPEPPDDPDGLLAWAEAHGVGARLDDVIVGGDGPAGPALPGRDGEALTYRQLLLAHDADEPGAAVRRRRHDAAETARGYLHRLAMLVTAAVGRLFGIAVG